MKVAFVFAHPFSESMGSVVRVRELALSLGTMGVEVYICTPYERSFDLSCHVHVISTSQIINDLRLAKPLYKLTKLVYYNKAFPRLFPFFDFQSNTLVAGAIKSFAKLLIENGIDVIQVEQDAALPIGIGLKKATGLPLISDLHNITSEELVATGLLDQRSSRFHDLQLLIRSHLLESDHVLVVSEKMRHYVVDNYYLGAHHISVIPPGGRITNNTSILDTSKKPRKIVYAGSVVHREHVDLFVKSIPLISKDHSCVQFYITNKGDDIRRIKQIALNIKANPNFFWFNDYHDVQQFLSGCSIGVLPSSSDIARQMGTPVKLFSYLSAGLPVVANNIGGWTEIVSRENVGLLTSDDPEDFGEALVSIIEDPCTLKKFALNGLELIKTKYNWDTSARKLLDIYSTYSAGN